MENVDALELSWIIQGPGSARFLWSTKTTREPIAIKTTYLGDALAEVIEVGIDLALGASSTWATFLGEPVGYRAFFSDAEGIVYVQLVRFDDIGSVGDRWSGGTLRWEGRVPKNVLTEAIYEMASRVARELGEEEYRRLWGSGFPVERLNMLRAIRERNA